MFHPILCPSSTPDVPTPKLLICGTKIAFFQVNRGLCKRETQRRKRPCPACGAPPPSLLYWYRARNARSRPPSGVCGPAPDRRRQSHAQQSRSRTADPSPPWQHRSPSRDCTVQAAQTRRFPVLQVSPWQPISSRRCRCTRGRKVRFSLLPLPSAPLSPWPSFLNSPPPPPPPPPDFSSFRRTKGP